MKTNGTTSRAPGAGVKVDRRTLHRALMNVSGLLSDAAGRMECVVLDVSLGGAMVKIDTDTISRPAPSTEIGDELVLTLECEVPVSLISSVVWFKGSIMGLKFLQESTAIASELARLLPPECFEGLAEREIATPRF